MEWFFPYLFHIQVLRVLRCVIKINWLSSFANKPDQPPRALDADLADRIKVETLRSHEAKMSFVLIQQVNSANLRTHGLLDSLNNNVQRRLQILCCAHFLCDLAKIIQHEN